MEFTRSIGRAAKLVQDAAGTSKQCQVVQNLEDLL